MQRQKQISTKGYKKPNQPKRKISRNIDTFCCKLSKPGHYYWINRFEMGNKIRALLLLGGCLGVFYWYKMSVCKFNIWKYLVYAFRALLL